MIITFVFKEKTNQSSKSVNLEEITCPKVIIRHTLVKMEMVFKVLRVEKFWSQHEAAGQGQLVYLDDLCFRFG